LGGGLNIDHEMAENMKCALKRRSRHFSGIARLLLIKLMTFSLIACAVVDPANEGGPRGEPLRGDQFLQSDFNRTMTLAMRDNLDSIYRLQEKLYKRNPRCWQAGGHASLEGALEHGRLGIRTATPPPGLDGLQDIDVLAVAFEPAYRGDRVAAFIYGLADMILTAHRDKSRFYLTDNIDAQHIFNAARNVETAAWLLNSRRDHDGQPLLLANQMEPQAVNLSFEREFGQLVGRLDLVASLLDEKIRRVGIGYVQGLFFFNFLPVR